MIGYNLEYLEELAAGDKGFLLSMISDFIEQTPNTLVQITDSINNNDYGTLYQLVHRFIPTLEYMGATELVRKYRDIEQFAKSKAEMETIKVFFEQTKVDTYAIIDILKHDFNK